MKLTSHKTGTREEWEAARAELAKLEADQAERGREITEKRLDLPWVPVEKDYEFDTEDGKKRHGRPVRGALAAARLQRHVRTGLRERRLPRLLELGRRAGWNSGST